MHSSRPLRTRLLHSPRLSEPLPLANSFAPIEACRHEVGIERQQNIGREHYRAVGREPSTVTATNSTIAFRSCLL